MTEKKNLWGIFLISKKVPHNMLYGFQSGEFISGAALRQVRFIISNAVNDFQAW